MRTVNEQLRAAKLLKANDDPVVKDDVLEGLTAVVTVRLPEPQFEGQTKEVLGTSAATRIVSHVVHRELTKALDLDPASLTRPGRARCSRRSSVRRAPGSPLVSPKSCSDARTRSRRRPAGQARRLSKR